MKKYIERMERRSLLISIIFIILGLFMLIKPDTATYLLLSFIGFTFVIDGLLHFVSYFTTDVEDRAFSYELAQAIIYVTVGALVAFNTGKLIMLVATVIGVWIVFDSIFKFQIAFNVKNYKGTKWGLLFVSAVASCVLGIILIFYPTESTEAVVRMCGLITVIAELLTIVSTWFALKGFDKNITIKNVIEVTEKEEVKEEPIEEKEAPHIEEIPKVETPKEETTLVAETPKMEIPQVNLKDIQKEPEIEIIDDDVEISNADAIRMEDDENEDQQDLDDQDDLY